MHWPEVSPLSDFDPLPEKKKTNSGSCYLNSVAFAEVTIVLAYFFRSFKIALPPGFQPPERKDKFTMEYSHPGLMLRFMAP